MADADVVCRIEDMYKELLFTHQDTGYKAFQSKLIPNVDAEKIIGVRTPVLKKIAKQLYQETDVTEFLNTLPHTYYEENNLHGLLIGQMKDYEECIMQLDRFLPYVDNWATCDLLRPKCFAKNTDKLITSITKFLNSEETYTIRFGIEMLMVHYLDAHFDKSCLQMVASVKSEQYYVNMMIAWYFATALAKQWEAALPYIEERRLGVWVHNKTIQKARESRRIGEEQKKYLAKLKVKE